MKKIFFLILVLFAAAFFSQSVKAQTEAQRIELCSKVANATVQGSYVVRLDPGQDGQRPPDFKQPFGLRAKNKYRITVCTDEESAGEAIVTLSEEGRVVARTFDAQSGVVHQSIDFDCTKTGVFVITVTIKDGRAGSAIVIVSHVKSL